MRSSRPEISSIPSAAPPGFVIVIACHDDHQKVKGCFPRYDSWGFVPRLVRSGGALMRNGSAVHIVATWQIMVGGVNAPLVWLSGFPTDFQFFCVWFLNPLFSSLSSSLFHFLRHFCFVTFFLRVVSSCNFLCSPFLCVPFSKVRFFLAFLLFVA